MRPACFVGVAMIFGTICSTGLAAQSQAKLLLSDSARGLPEQQSRSPGKPKSVRIRGERRRQEKDDESVGMRRRLPPKTNGGKGALMQWCW